MNPDPCFYCTDAYKDYMQEICRLDTSTVFLHNEQEYPGRCIVVLNDHKTELFQLSPAQRASYMDSVAAVAQAVDRLFNPVKINYAVYGDIDSHIHFHVVPKHHHSKNWGMPFEVTTGQDRQKFLTPQEYQDRIDLIRSALRDIMHKSPPAAQSTY